MTPKWIRLKYLADINRDSLPDTTDPELEIRYIDISSVGQGRLAAEPSRMRFSESPLRARRLVRKDDVIISTVRTYLRAVWPVLEPTDNLVVSTGFAVVSPHSIDAKYLSWCLQSDAFLDELTARSVGVSYPAIDVATLGNIRIQLPSMAKQRTLANFLESATAPIEALIARKRQLQELIGERRLLLADETLVDMREVRRSIPLKRLVAESNQRYGSASLPTILSVSIHHGVVPRHAIVDDESRVDDFSSYKACVPGDIVINRMRAFQGGVGIVRHTGVVSPDYTVLKTGDQILSDYLHYVMRSRWFVSEMTKRLRGIGAADQLQVRTPRVNWADLGLIEIPVPSLKQQESIALELDQKDRNLARVVTLLDRQISLLKIRRLALTDAVIAGQEPIDLQYGLIPSTS